MAPETSTLISAKQHVKKGGKSGKKAGKSVVEKSVVVEADAPKSEKKRKSKEVAEPTDLAASTTNKKSKISAVIEPNPSAPVEKKLKGSKPKKVEAKEPSPEPVPEVEEEEAQEDSDADSVHLHGFSTDDDSSDEEDMDADAPEFDAAKLPSIKDDATVRRKLEKAKRQPTEDRGVLYLGRLPHGFYEDQLRAYFSQFGTITRLRLSRNKTTGASKHCAFMEFDSSSVAEIVADTMNNYLIMGHLMRCKVIPKDSVHPELWVGANRKFRKVPIDRVTMAKHNKFRTEDEQKRTVKRLLKRQSETKRKLEKAGIDYSFDAVSYKKPKTVDAAA